MVTLKCIAKTKNEIDGQATSYAIGFQVVTPAATGAAVKSPAVLSLVTADVATYDGYQAGSTYELVPTAATAKKAAKTLPSPALPAPTPETKEPTP